MRNVLDKNFFKRPVLTVAEDLIGKYLVCENGEGIITEVEAYDGPEDKACHGCKGLTERTKPMFGQAGCWYVYLCYGMYWMLNIVTGEEGYPAAVLIRGVGELDGLSCTGAKRLMQGPGKLTKNLKIDKSFNGLKSDKKTGLWIEDRGEIIKSSEIKRTPRIGVAYAKEWAQKPYRFVLYRL